jgi:hypothetical protein
MEKTKGCEHQLTALLILSHTPQENPKHTYHFHRCLPCQSLAATPPTLPLAPRNAQSRPTAKTLTFFPCLSPKARYNTPCSGRILQGNLDCRHIAASKPRLLLQGTAGHRYWHFHLGEGSGKPTVLLSTMLPDRAQTQRAFRPAPYHRAAGTATGLRVLMDMDKKHLTLTLSKGGKSCCTKEY